MTARLMVDGLWLMVRPALMASPWGAVLMVRKP